MTYRHPYVMGTTYVSGISHGKRFRRSHFQGKGIASILRKAHAFLQPHLKTLGKIGLNLAKQHGPALASLAVNKGLEDASKKGLLSDKATNKLSSVAQKALKEAEKHIPKQEELHGHEKGAQELISKLSQDTLHKLLGSGLRGRSRSGHGVGTLGSGVGTFGGNLTLADAGH